MSWKPGNGEASLSKEPSSGKYCQGETTFLMCMKWHLLHHDCAPGSRQVFMGKRVETRKKDKCRVTGALSDVLRLKAARESPECACSPQRANGEPNSGSRDLASRDVSSARVRTWISCIVPWWTSLSVRLHLSFLERWYFLPEWESRRLFAGPRAGRQESLSEKDWLLVFLENLPGGSPAVRSRFSRRSLSSRFSKTTQVIWLILPVVICSSQRLSHACRSTGLLKVKPRKAH